VGPVNIQPGGIDTIPIGLPLVCTGQINRCKRVLALQTFLALNQLFTRTNPRYQLSRHNPFPDVIPVTRSKPVETLSRSKEIYPLPLRDRTQNSPGYHLYKSHYIYLLNFLPFDIAILALRMLQ
jgi:hypothetical protein